MLGRQTGASGSPVGCGRLRLAYLSGVQGDGHPSDEIWVEGGLLRLQSPPAQMWLPKPGFSGLLSWAKKSQDSTPPAFPPSFRKPSVPSCKQGSPASALIAHCFKVSVWLSPPGTKCCLVHSGAQTSSQALLS